MTKEQAIEWLKSLNYCDGEETQEVAQAIEIAIKALEQQPCDDCISRQAVLDILSHYAHNFGADNEIKALPSVTPTQCIATVQFSKDDLREICNERIEIECIHGTCKDCRWLTTDEDGNYYCRQTGYFDSLDFYCKDFEKAR